MKTFIIKLKKTNSEERSIHRKRYMSFQEAASKAYMIRAKLGSSWTINSITEEQC